MRKVIENSLTSHLKRIRFNFHFAKYLYLKLSGVAALFINRNGPSRRSGRDGIYIKEKKKKKRSSCSRSRHLHSLLSKTFSFSSSPTSRFHPLLLTRRFRLYQFLFLFFISVRRFRACTRCLSLFTSVSAT